MRFKKLLLIPVLALAAFLTAAPARAAADEWIKVSSLPDFPDHCRYPHSDTDGGPVEFIICWDDALTSVFVNAYAADRVADGYHVEAQIRYQIRTGDVWSGWHYRTPASAAGKDTFDENTYRARYITGNVQGRGCLYDGDTRIHCNGWA